MIPENVFKLTDFFLLPDWDYIWSCVLNFSFYLLYSSSPEFIFVSLFYEFYFLLNFLFQSCILSWVHWFVYLCLPESCWASLKLFSVLSQIMCRLYPWVSCWSITDISAFEGTFISFSLSGLTLVRKDIHLEVAVRVLAGWDAASFVPGKSQWHSPHAILLVEIDVGQMVGGSSWPGLQRTCRSEWQVGLFRSSAAEVFLFSPFFF